MASDEERVAGVLSDLFAEPLLAQLAAVGMAMAAGELRLRERARADAEDAVRAYLTRRAAADEDAGNADGAAVARWAATAPAVDRWAAELEEAARAAWPERGAPAVDGGELYGETVAALLMALSPETRELVKGEWATLEGWAGLAVVWRWAGVELAGAAPLTVDAGGPLTRDELVRRMGSALATLAARMADGPPGYMVSLCRDLWRTRWAEEAGRLYARPPALLMPVHRDIGHALASLGRSPDDGGQLHLPGLVAVVMQEGVEALDRALRAASEVSPMLAHRVVRALVAWGAAAWAAEGLRVRLADDIDGQRTAGGAVELFIAGGRETLRVAVGSTKKGDRVADVLDILASHGARWQRPGLRGGGALLEWWDDQRQTAGRRAVAVVKLGALLLPGLASEDGVPVADRVLVPALPVPPMPPKGWRGWVGPLAALDWLALQRLADARAELAAEGGVALRWPVLAREVEASPAALAAALPHWQACGRYREVSPGRWALGDGAEEQRAHALLMDGAALSQRAREAGRRSAARRRGARE